MPLPLIKVAIVTVRTFARPFNVMLTRYVKHSANVNDDNFFSWFGMKCYRFENKIEEMVNGGKEFKGIPVGIDLSKVSHANLVAKGIDVFIELTMFYGILMALACWELSKKLNESKIT